MKKIEKISYIEIMYNKIIENSVNRPSGFPVACILIDKVSDKKISFTNQRAISKSTNNENHAEYKCIKEFYKNNTYDAEIIIIITIPPCSDCLKVFKKNWKVFYFFDEIREKSEKEYLLPFKEKKLIEKLELSNKKINQVAKFKWFYIVAKYLAGCLTQRTSTKDYETIENAAKTFLKKLKDEIKIVVPNKSDYDAKLWNMIDNANKMNVDMVMHRQKRRKVKEAFFWIVD